MCVFVLDLFLVLSLLVGFVFGELTIFCWYSMLVFKCAFPFLLLVVRHVSSAMLLLVFLGLHWAKDQEHRPDPVLPRQV